MSDKRKSDIQVIINALDPEILSVIVELIKSEQKDNITFESPTKECYRPPFEGGVHKIMYLALGVSQDE